MCIYLWYLVKNSNIYLEKMKKNKTKNIVKFFEKIKQNFPKTKQMNPQFLRIQLKIQIFVHEK